MDMYEDEEDVVAELQQTMRDKLRAERDAAVADLSLASNAASECGKRKDESVSQLIYRLAAEKDEARREAARRYAEGADRPSDEAAQYYARIRARGLWGDAEADRLFPKKEEKP